MVSNGHCHKLFFHPYYVSTYSRPSERYTFHFSKLIIFCIASQRKVNHWYSEQNLKWEMYRYNCVPIGYYATMKRTLTMPLWWKIHIHILLSSLVIVSYLNNLQQETCKKWKVIQCWGPQDHHNRWIQFWLWSAWLCSGKIDKHFNFTVACVWIQIWNRV